VTGGEADSTHEPSRAEVLGNSRHAPVGLKFKLLYGSGALVDGIITAALTYYLLFYLTAVCGLSGSFAGTALLIGLLVDALVEPAIGLLSDNTRSRMGRRLPFMVYGTLPVAVVFALLFSMPASVGHAPLLVYATFCSMAVRIGQSVFNIPYVAVGAEVTDDYSERSSITSYRVCYSMLGIFLAIGLGLGVFMAGPAGLLNRQAYVPFGWTCAALITVGGFGGALATRSVLPRLHVSDRAGGPVFRTFLFEIRDILRNRSFVVLFLAVLAFLVGQGMAAALAIYLYRYFWNLSTTTVQLVLLATTLGPFVGAPLTTLLGRHIEKKPLAIANFSIFVLCQFWPPLARIAGFLPGHGTAVITILILNALVAGAALIGGTIGAQSMMADATDEHEFLFGVRREGLFFSGLTLAAKAATGLGGFMAGVALDLIHFPTSIAAKSADLRLPAEVVRDLGLISGPLPAVITLFAPLALCAYALSQAKHSAILAELKRRRDG
jgi:GPH family glycoside/pentoside/hexuronide:cation symporter